MANAVVKDEKYITYMMYAPRPTLSIFYNCIVLANVDNIYRILLYCKKIQ